MTQLELLPYECIVCKKIFLSYFEVIDDKDKKLIKDTYEDKGIDYLHPIRGERKCKKCRKGLQLDMFFDVDDRTIS